MFTPVNLAITVIAGIVIGAIINALADDLPHRRPVTRPHYPDGTPRPPVAWIGLLAFLLGQRAAPSGSKLSWRHPLTELGTAALLALTLWAGADDPDMSMLQMLFWFVYMAIFMLITVIDLEHRLILFVVIIPSYFIALLDPLLTSYGAPLGESLIGAAMGFGIFFLLYLGGYGFTWLMATVQKRQINDVAFGYGDVMLMTLSGLILGWRALIFAMFITVFLGALGAAIYLIVRRLAGRHYSMFTPLPYGQYIVFATVIMLLFAIEISKILQGRPL